MNLIIPIPRFLRKAAKKLLPLEWIEGYEAPSELFGENPHPPGSTEAYLFEEAKRIAPKILEATKESPWSNLPIK